VTATPTAGPVATTTAPTLHRLHLTRAGFALVWAVGLVVAVALAPTPSTIGPVIAALLVLYPLVDVGAAIVDARSSRSDRSVPGLSANIVISAVAAVGLVVAVTSGVPAVLQVWGAWAVVAGLVQLVVALGRRGLGGRWAMIASGTISVFAGIAFVLQGTAGRTSLAALAGYALLGGVFFLVSALRQGRTTGNA
jgi:uncharacterized membrane protein HdeD (DUF308 family)